MRVYLLVWPASLNDLCRLNEMAKVHNLVTVLKGTATLMITMFYIKDLNKP